MKIRRIGPKLLIEDSNTVYIHTCEMVNIDMITSVSISECNGGYSIDICTENQQYEPQIVLTGTMDDYNRIIKIIEDYLTVYF